MTIPKEITSIGEYSFQGCSYLTSLTFEDESQLTTIGQQAFYEANIAGALVIPTKVTYIGIMTFANNNITSVSMSGCNMTNIMQGAFQGCMDLTAVTMPTSLDRINWGAFGNYPIEEDKANTALTVTFPGTTVPIINASSDTPVADTDASGAYIDPFYARTGVTIEVASTEVMNAFEANNYWSKVLTGAESTDVDYWRYMHGAIAISVIAD